MPPVSARIKAAACSAFVPSRPNTSTRAPRAAKPLAMPRLIPLVPPEMKTTWSAIALPAEEISGPRAMRARHAAIGFVEQRPRQPDMHAELPGIADPAMRFDHLSGDLGIEFGNVRLGESGRFGRGLRIGIE